MAKSKTILEITKKGGHDPLFEAFIPKGTDVEDVLDGIARTLASMAVCSGVALEELMENIEDYISETGSRMAETAKENNDTEAARYLKEVFSYYLDFEDDEDFDDDEEFDDDYDEDECETLTEEQIKSYVHFTYQWFSGGIEGIAKEMHCSVEDVMADLKRVLEKDEDNRDSLIETIINERFPTEEESE